RYFLVLSSQHRWRRRTRIGLLQRWREFVELAGIGRAEQCLVDDRNFLDATERALELEASLAELAFPAAFGRFGKRVKPPGDVLRRRGRADRIAGDLRAEHAGDGGLLDHLAIVPAVQAAQ